ncbi:MAG: hypothetical protein JNM99_12150 [Verrucomicrobiaceae bacterium]|nr:hypothetical protein [Verrucomicrobiaceae bacterium]
MPHQFRTVDQRVWKASQAIVLWRADGSRVEGIWGGSATEERLDWWLRKPGNELTQTDEIAAVAVRDDESKEVRWGDAPQGARLFFVLEAPVIGKSGEAYRLAKMVTTAATSAQASYFCDDRFALLGRFNSEGLISRMQPLAPPPLQRPIQGELF